jgi:hypothetical protein
LRQYPWPTCATTRPMMKQLAIILSKIGTTLISCEPSVFVKTAKCGHDLLLTQRFGPRTPLPAEIWASWFQNNSCSPFTNESTPCVLGNQAVFSVNVSGVDDIVAGLAFARTHNIRLVIKNTGHEYVLPLLLPTA